ncbi:MAG: prepilin-type N-terminal cleavage/methylation domain-containing protein [Planctomycetes bacterium]|nr:prepilin-type N-terminal cleavage/methylation domain-containing protein [Planctomycetota bacterium]
MKDHDKLNKNTATAFTLVELLVVISIIAVLLAVLLPALSIARAQGRAVICRSNAHQLFIANTGYATENDGYYVPAAKDILGKNLHRWHGVRKEGEYLFDPLKGPLAGYLGDGKVKECPGKVKFVRTDDWDGSYEKGGGGYGYNQTYIGSRIWQLGWTNDNEAYEKTTRMTEIAKTAQTIMFADCAMVQIVKNEKNLIEYSFAQPPFWLSNGKPMKSWGYASPSIHFRHRNKASVAWADGHISPENRTEYNGRNGYGVKSADFDIGWFGPLDNSLFDLE